MKDSEVIADELNKTAESFKRYNDDSSSFEIGICFIKLEDYKKSREWFKKSFDRMFDNRPFWKTGHPDHFVDVWLMSDNIGSAKKVRNELDEFRKHPHMGDSPLAHYAYCMWDLKMVNEPLDPNKYANLMQLENRNKYGFYLGSSLSALSTQNTLQFIISLQGLLKAHEGLAKHGGLRWTAERFICLSAMSLGLLAIKRGLAFNIESDYFSLGYLEYLLQQS